ncbi:phosphatase PAP2 family protein [Rufibacter quisquiliarum]|uniref:Membrane-associated phospholipid phosphatase n=1 Tax=Rufibacter quisquiliarum TaxID=1549639 RepID=A0A839GWU2_9BACT|nr:phosphatase PAP2 family protein [Rufibacter quisquiliarum]MBA9078888.1 membrane-associated phospholipid phosphatase [Rufibacter quisquiliarum]
MRISALPFLFVFSLWLSLPLPLHAQPPEKIYHTSLLRDGLITAGGVTMAVTGSLLLTNKDRLTEADLASINPDQVNKFDRWAAGNYSKKAQDASDIPFYTSFALPLLFLADQNARPHAPDIYFLYAQTVSLAGGLYALTAGLTNRKRPNVYATHAPVEERLHKYATNSFFAGHTAATASATFFTAKVFHDLHPNSPWRPVVWTAAAAVPATVGYLRLKAGKHFLSDNLIGYAVGASIGILVPELHKNNHETSWRLVPSSEAAAGDYLQGVALTKRF